MEAGVNDSLYGGGTNNFGLPPPFPSVLLNDTETPPVSLKHTPLLVWCLFLQAKRKGELVRGEGQVRRAGVRVCVRVLSYTTVTRIEQTIQTTI